MTITFIILIVEEKIIYKIRVNKDLKIVKEVFIKLNSKNGSPDGMTLDINDNLWVATFGGAKLLVFNKNRKLNTQLNFQQKILQTVHLEE